MMNIYEVNRHLRQRPPFQMIERVLELTPGTPSPGSYPAPFPKPVRSPSMTFPPLRLSAAS